MKITLEILKNKKAYSELLQYFQIYWNNKIDYKEILKQCELDFETHGIWIMENLKLTGSVKMFYFDNILKYEIFYKDGLLNGISTFYNHNKTVRKQYNYIDGELCYD